jgi:beta-glucanase (GH16 family)
MYLLKVNYMKNIYTFGSALSSQVLLLTVMLGASVTNSYAGWEVTWIDDFNGTGVDWNNWTAQTQANYNNEIQCYTDDETDNVGNYKVSDGTLKITARRQNINCPGLNDENRPWTSGRLNSKDKGEFLYGRIEARLRFDELKGGTWPAFWMLENRIAEQPIKGDNDNVNWPNPGAGEIDVWEWYGNSGGDNYITNFFNANNCGAEKRIPYQGGAPDVMSFQTYGIEWGADFIEFFMNDQVVAEYDLSNCPQYEEPMFILLNVAIGGSLGGNIDPQLNTATLEVDYVAHCVASDANASANCNQSTPTITDDDNDRVRNEDDECPETANNTEVDASGCEIIDTPLTSAPDVDFAAENVISLFSDQFTNIQDIDYNPDWNQATVVTQENIDGNNTLNYSNLNYQGTDFSNNKQDVSQMDFLRFDYWTKAATQLSMYLISPGPQETPFVVNVQSQSWQSVTIPLTAFTNVDLTDIFQLKVTGNGDVLLDNIIFTRTATENNVAPELSLSATQNLAQVTSITTTDGMVVINAIVTDSNQQDTHNLQWDVTGVSDFTTDGNQISFNPAALTVSQIVISAQASDNGSPSLSVSRDLTLILIQPDPVVVAQPDPVEPENSSGGTISLYMFFGLTLIVLRRKYLQRN